MARAHNWADNHDYAAAVIHRPASIDEARELVARAPRIHAVGARHAFNAAADSPGAMIDLGGIAPDFQLDTAARIVTCGAGVRYADLAAWLAPRGWALANMASLPQISLAGAVATGTHGSGDRLGSLATQVASLAMIGADGSLATLRRGEADFAGAVVAMGALGVVARIGLDVEPAYRMRQDAYADLPWEALVGATDDVMGAGTSVSLFTQWSTPRIGRVWIKTRLDEGVADAPPPAPAGAMPTDTPGVNPSPDAHLRRTPFGVAAGWEAILWHMRAGFEPGPPEQIQSEYMVPRAAIGPAVAGLRAMGERIDAALLVNEIRSMAGDGLWLSPAEGGARIALHFTWKKMPAEVAALTREIEALLLPLGGRPHWGKVIHAPAAALAPLYPRFGAFRALAAARDPGGKFRNAFLERHVLG